MKKTLLILCALLLTAVGASAQATPYEFKAEDWEALSDHSGTTATPDTESNTISVTYGASGEDNGTEAGIGNMDVMSTSGANTAGYYVTADQCWFVIKGKGLSTSGHLLWWMNGLGGLTVAPSEVITLDDGVVMLAWDLSKSGYDVNLQNETNALSGGICFGLIADGDTGNGGSFTITHIGFYTEEEVEEYLTTTPYTFNASEWVALADHTGTTATANDTGNTISVTYSDAEAGIANSHTASNPDPTIGVTTGLYTITKDQHWFVIEGTGLSTTSTDHQLWWMNGQGGFALSPTVYELDESVVLAWDLSKDNLDAKLQPDADGNILLDGWTCFGLKAASGYSFTISDIGFYTETDFEELIQIEPYTFVATDWVASDNGRATADDITYNEDGTITVKPATNNNYNGANCIALGNSNEKSQYGGITTAKKYITSEQKYFVIIGSDLATGKTVTNNACDSYLWWVNGFNDGSQIAPDEVVTLSDDQVLVAWDISNYVTAGEDGKIILNGWTCFGLTSTKTSSTISYIGFYTEAQLDAATKGIQWEMTEAGWGTLILPFDAEIPTATDEGDEATLTLYAGSALSLGTTDEDGNTALTLGDASETIVANTPYLVNGTAGTYTFTGTPINAQNSYSDGLLTGTFVDMAYDDFTANSGQYVLQNHTGEGEGGLGFYPVTEDSAPTGDDASTGASLDAYHCYLTYSGASGGNVRGFISFPSTDDEATRIVAVESEEEAEGNGAIYDLSGRKVSKAVKGVYIQNGKKVLVK